MRANDLLLIIFDSFSTHEHILLLLSRLCNTIETFLRQLVQIPLVCTAVAKMVLLCRYLKEEFADDMGLVFKE